MWADIETALGEYDEDRILDFCRPSEGIDYDHTIRSIAAIEDSPDYIFKPVLDEFIENHEQWVNSIDISFANPYIQLSKQSLYLTFNYTETLETVYGIPSGQITHIHGSRKVNEDDYVLGHNNYRDSNSCYRDEDGLPFEQNAKRKIVSYMDELTKNIPEQIKRCSDFFSNLSGIETVIVRGHSMNVIDMPYFDAVIENISSSARWILYCYSSEDYKRANEFISSRNIQNFAIKCY